ncbi:TIGR04283 family arsenosugar biosynthesis glycosyltransferase [Aurantibacter sp.]|uniref:TIGR04283 family arsenosugar biosynthesis glycosyltransferase n=1 Tax=Aurantibacter sp. TaxID=2807103 RepID=UPI003263BBAD
MISIIIPAHNEIKNLKRLLPLLVNLCNNEEAEIIVALSSENSDETKVVLNQEKVQFLKCLKKGRAVQMNSAAKIVKGDVLVFLHADVLPPKYFLSNIRTALKEVYEAGFFSYRFDNDSFLLRINAFFTGKSGFFTGGGDQCLFIKKSTFDRLNGFDENQCLMEDFEFFERMKENQIQYTIIQNDLIVSSRKYECNSYLRVNLSNLVLVILFKLGYPAKKLKSIHNKLIRSSYQKA